MKRILVLGGGGHSGIKVVQELDRRGYIPVVLYRRNLPPIESNKVEFLKGDASKSEDLAGSIENCHGVINCIGFGKGSGKETHFFSKVNLDLIQLMPGKGVSNLITMSNIGVFKTGNRFVYGFMVPTFMKWLKHIVDDKERMENALKGVNNPKWACARFPNIVDGEEKSIRSNEDGKGLSLSITTSSIAKVLVDLLEDESKRSTFLSFSN